MNNMNYGYNNDIEKLDFLNKINNESEFIYITRIKKY